MYHFLKQIRSALLVFLTHHLALPFLKIVRKPKPFPYSMQQLSAMPQGSLGFALQQFLVQRNLQLLPYYAKHDIKHILLQYDTTDEGEVCLQTFMLGNGHVSFPVIATVLYGFITMPEYWRQFRIAYRSGKQASDLSTWDWFAIVPQPTEHLQHLIFNK
ncbi:hypothetical protein ACFOWM_05985 [Ferruginibacter yonginensis]|uniref:Ubiquinone biosynthesis protein COQ4 n=1 Tax=Ferruginibacter yonginensis TaxID=1310416 RepID=A0ABV8QQ58_9BACT